MRVHEMSILVELIDFFENGRLLSESSAGSKVLLLPKTRNLMIQKIITQMCVWSSTFKSRNEYQTVTK